jgi:hypothetical protein
MKKQFKNFFQAAQNGKFNRSQFSFIAALTVLAAMTPVLISAVS